MNCRKPLLLSEGTGSGCVHPDIHYFYDQEDYKYWLYYTPYPYDEDELPFLMRSNNGREFTEDGVSNPLFKTGPRGSWDEHHLADIDVVMVKGSWYMYFVGVHFEKRKKIGQIGLATSKNGLNWKKHKSNPILSPSRKLFWEGGTPKHVTVSTPSVVYLNGVFYMWYSSKGKDSRNRIGFAESKDGFTFRKHEQNPIIQPEYDWEEDSVNHCDVVYHDGVFWMFYVGGNGPRYLGLAYALEEEPSNWYKYEGNPILVPDIDRSSTLKVIWCMLHIPRFTRGVQRLGKCLESLTRRFLWRTASIYRTSPLSDTRSGLIVNKHKILLYYSGYDLFDLPEILTMNFRLPNIEPRSHALRKGE